MRYINLCFTYLLTYLLSIKLVSKNCITRAIRRRKSSDPAFFSFDALPVRVVDRRSEYRAKPTGGSRPGPGGGGGGGGGSAPHFLSRPQFFHRVLINAPPHSERGGPPPRVFWLEPPLAKRSKIKSRSSRSTCARITMRHYNAWYTIL